MRDKRMVPLKEKIAAFRQQYPRAEAPPPQTCAECDGSGFSYGPHTDWEKVFCGCPKGQRLQREQMEFEDRVRTQIHDARQQLLQARFAAAGIQERHEEKTVDALPESLRQGREKAIYAVEHLRQGKGVPVPSDGGVQVFRNAVFHGPVGTGKSAMLSEIAAAWIEAGHTAMIIQWDWMIAAIQNTYNNNGESWLTMLEDIVRADIVLIDDLGDPDNAQPLSPDQRSKLYMIVDRRYGTNNKPFILSTNFSSEKFTWLVGRRIFNRLEEIAVFVPVGGVNLRSKHAKALLSES